MRNRYLDSLALPEIAIESAEFSQISTWIIAIIDQYSASRAIPSSISTTYSIEELDLLYFLPQDELISQLIHKPLESPASENYREFLLALYHILPQELKIKWLKFELSSGVLAANTLAYQYQDLKKDHLAMISSVSATAKSSTSEAEDITQNNNFVRLDLPNINIHPGINTTHPVDSEVQLTMGDAHGNVLLMIHFLIYQGVMVLSEEDYRVLVRRYHELSAFFRGLKKLLSSNSTAISEIVIVNEKITKLMDDFIKTMTTKSRFNNVGLIRWMGDIVGDRGVLDYLVLKLLEHMKNSCVPYEIILSNHDLNLITFYELCLNNPLAEIDMERITGKFTTTPCDSIENTLILVELGILDHHEICRIINYCYKPALKLLSCTINKSGTKGNIFTHAPIQEDVIPAIAERLGLRIQTDNIYKFLRSIENINNAIQIYVEANMLMDILNPYLEYETRGFNPKRYNIASNPFITILFNKDLELMPLTPIAGCEFVQVHGHETVLVPRRGFEGLDSLLGKEIHFHDVRNPIIPKEYLVEMIYRALHSRQNSELGPKISSSRETLPGYHGGFFASLPKPAPETTESSTKPDAYSSSGRF